MIIRTLILFCLFSTALWSQDSPMRLDRQQYQQLERLWTKYDGGYKIFPSNRSISRKKISQFIANLPINEMSGHDLNIVDYWVKENPEWFQDSSFLAENMSSLGSSIDYNTSDYGFWQSIYRMPSNFLFINKKDFFLAVNPIIHWKYGQQSDGYAHIFENKKGLDLRAGVDRKIFIYTKIEDLQFSRPGYIENYINTYRSIPGYNFYSNYNSSLIPEIKGRDVLNSEAYMTIPIGKYVSTQFGYGRQFIGSGVQSLLLSDFGPNYLHLNFDIEIWKLKYRFTIAEMTAISPQQDIGDQLLPKKFVATHMLQFMLGQKAHLGLFESIVFGRDQQLEWHYLLPVILFRSVERSIGSPDNVLLGLDFSWSIFHRSKLYSQFIMDEFKLKEIKDNNGWWANKFGVQIGLKTFDIFNVQDLNWTIEFNTVRPYTYAHRDSITTYTHNNSPLAHPLGANFKEVITTLDYNPFRRWYMSGAAYWIRQGLSTDDINYGNDVRTSTSYNRASDYGNKTLQGMESEIFGLQGRISYQLWHQGYLDLNIGIRSQDKNNNLWGSVAFRLNAQTSGNSIF
ncbi:hypothetical protein [Membranihabitans marinus]|uniref:hypothetical protein n=1 Tax=Membranihabitans marinus TaxID=1227546 RepID=UPI001F33B2D4|nr:hypothetical protein [Membranihabitans marinus]